MQKGEKNHDCAWTPQTCSHCIVLLDILVDFDSGSIRKHSDHAFVTCIKIHNNTAEICSFKKKLNTTIENLNNLMAKLQVEEPGYK